MAKHTLPAVVFTAALAMGLPSNIDFGPPGTSAIPTSAIIVQWDLAAHSGTVDSPAPDIGTGAATALGMTNSYAGPAVGCTGAGCEYTGSSNKDDVTGETGGADPSLNAQAWRTAVRGLSGGTTGNSQAPQYTQGAQFSVSTMG